MSTLSEDCKHMQALFEEATRLDKLAKEVRAEAKEAEAQLMERMEQEDCDSHSTGGKLYTKVVTNYHVIQDRAAFEEWAASYDEELLEVKPKGDLLNALIRQRLDDGEPLPPGLGFYPKEYISKTAR